MISFSEGVTFRECHDRKIAKIFLFRSLTLKEVTFRKWAIILSVYKGIHYL